MKKILVGLLFGVLFLGMALSVLAVDITVPDPSEECRIRADPKRAGVTDCPWVTTTVGGVDCEYTGSAVAPIYDGGNCPLCCGVGLLIYVTDIVFAVAVVAVVLFTAWGAYEIVASGGDPKKFEAGKNKVIYAAIGTGAAILMKAIPLLVSSLV